MAGELRDPRKAALPVAAALGGMLVPAAIYLALEHGRPSQRGWGVPMATDIAFVVGVMALLGLLGMVIGEQAGTWLIVKKVNVAHAASTCLYGKHWDKRPEMASSVTPPIRSK